MRVDFGGVGCNRADQWVTVNLCNDLRPESDIVADFTAKANQLDSHFERLSIDEARSIHCLEHVASDQIIPTLHYWRYFLKSGAPLVIVVPDLGAMAVDYADGVIPFDVFAAVAYVPGSRVGDRPEEIHRWGFSDKTLYRTMCEAGYKDVQLGGDEHWPATWTFDMHELSHTGLIGRYEVPNLIMVGKA